MGIGQKIKQLRERAALTQEELAELIGVTASAVGNYEREVSHPREDVLYRLFDALRAEPNELFSDCYSAQSPAREHMEMYLALDEHGRSLVDVCTQMEYRRCTKSEEVVYAAARGGSGGRIKLKKRAGAGSILDRPTYKGGSL